MKLRNSLIYMDKNSLTMSSVEMFSGQLLLEVNIEKKGITRG